MSRLNRIICTSILAVRVDYYRTNFDIVSHISPVLPCTHRRQETPRPPSFVPSTLSLCVILGLATWSSPSLAIGYGKLAGEAVIGEPLHVEIPIVGTVDRPLGKECVTLQRVADPTDLEYFPRDLGVRLETQGNSPRIVVTNQNALRQPLVEFRISVGCGYNLSHDYTLMAAPRKGDLSVDSAGSSAGRSVSPATTAGRSFAAPRAETSGATANIASPTTIARLPDGLQGRNIVLDEDLTLEQLAQRHFPGPLRQQRFMRWVVEANPELFINRDGLRHQRLRSGTSLVIPDGVPPRRPGDHQGAINPIGERREASDPAISVDRVEKTTVKAAEQTPRSSSGPTKDRLVVGGAARNMKEAIAIVDQLTGMMEKQVETQAAYNEKIKDLETTVTDLAGRLKSMEADAAKREAEWQAARQAEKADREREAEEAWWKLLAAVVGGGLVGAGALFGLSSLFGKKKSSPDEDFADHEMIPNRAPPVAPEAPRNDPVVKFAWENTPPTEDRHVESDVSDEITERGLAPANAPKPNLPDVEFDIPVTHDASPSPDDIPSDPSRAAIELASIMTSMGLAESAAQTLVEYIRENPKESLPQWLKLLEIHRISGNRTEFERSASELRQQFNIKPTEWSDAGSSGRDSLEAYTHVRSQLIKLWRTPECTDFLRSLLQDNREGTRLGFPLPVVEDILLLVAILNSNE